jgi:GDP-4-dehydro-6-deoxy-D-mannose reductase
MSAAIPGDRSALIIAGTSFVGRHLREHLRALDVPFHATSRTPSPHYHSCDLHEPAQIDALLESLRPRWIFQCGGVTGQANRAELYRLHERATEDLLTAVRRHVPDAVVVLFGSAAEYGPVPPEGLPIGEETPARPQSPYGQSKLAQFYVAQRMAHAHRLRVHVVRPFNILGPGLGNHYVAGALLRRLRELKKAGKSGDVPIVNGSATRDLIDVRDVVDAVCRLALDAPPETGEVGLFNIATGQETPVLELAAHLCQLAGGFHAVDAGAANSRSAIDRSCGDASRLEATTGWRPRWDWRRSLRDMWGE